MCARTLTFGSNRASAALSWVISSSVHEFPFRRCHSCHPMHKRRSGLPSPQPLARSKLSPAQSVFTAFFSPRRPAQFIFIYFRERIGYCRSMRDPIRVMVTYRGRSSWIGRARHSDLQLARTITRPRNPFFVKSAVTSNRAMQPTAGRRTASLSFMKTHPLQATLALASGG
jgi:hypothetical protein